MDLVALSNELHGSVQMDSVALFSWIGWLRHHGILSWHFIELVKEKYKDYLYIEGMPEDKSNVAFYVKHGFQEFEGAGSIIICNSGKKE